MRNRLVKGTLAALGVSGALVACSSEPDGLLATPASSTGPKVVFDLLARPLPEIPFPSDIATRIDLDSPTGRRVNASMMAATILEKDVREEFNLLDGFGTFSPMTVSFEAPIDPVAVRDAHLDDDFANDAVYLVNLTTGEPVALDLGRGNFPVVLQETEKYFMNDQRVRGSNMLYETYQEEDTNGNGVLDPEEDTDADGHWDTPNTVDPTKPLAGVDPATRVERAADRGNDVYRDLLTWYERESNTLIIRPVVVLDQRTTYAVVLSNRIRTPDGRVVRSPFPYVNHAAQTEQLRPLLGHLGKGRLAGLKPEDVAFAWAFTTQSVTTDLEAIRAGLYGEGTLKFLGTDVSDRLEQVRLFNEDARAVENHPTHPLRVPGATSNLYTVPMSEFQQAFKRLGGELGINEGADIDNVVDGYKFVDYFVVGSFRTANFLDDPKKPTYDAVFRVNAKDGQVRMWKRPDDWSKIEEEAIVASVLNPIAPETAMLRQRAKLAVRDRVWFMLAVPKALNGHTAPFPVSIYGHGYTSARVEMLGFAGNLAKFGIASVGIDSYGHGLDVSQTERAAIEAIIGQYGFAPLVDALFKSRARDLDNDLTDNSGGDFWVADTFHTRDIVRQSIIDWMQLIRVFKAFGTYEMGDVNGDGTAELAGDFNADGVPDVGGPEHPTQDWWTKKAGCVEVPGSSELDCSGAAGKRNEGADFFAWGQSLGGILAGILPAVEPAVAAAAPVAGGGGLADIGIRSEQGGVIQAVFMEILGPILATTKEGENKAHLWYHVQNVNDDERVRLTDEPIDLRPGDRVRAWNPYTDDGEEQKEDWAIVGDDLAIRLQVAADNAAFADGAPVWQMESELTPKTGPDGKPLLLEPLRVGRCEPEATLEAEKARTGMIRPADCLKLEIVRGGVVVQTIDKFPRDLVFQNRRFAKDTPLVALARGFAMKRQSKVFRRFMSLAQTILEPGDPGNYSAQYFLKPLAARKNKPAAVLVVGTTGDLNVPVNTAITQGRIAGVVPYVYDAEKHGAWGMSPNDVLIRSKATEAIEKLRYYEPVAKHAAIESTAAKEDFLKSLPPDDQDIVKLVNCSFPSGPGGVNPCDRTTLVDVTGYAFDPETGTYLDSRNSIVPMRYGGAPRLKASLRDAFEREYDGVDAKGEKVKVKSAMIMPFLDTHGKHGFDVPHPDDAFDIDLFMINMIGRYFQTRGQELRYDVCMHRDGYDRKRLIRPDPNEDPVLDPEAERIEACSFIPPFPATF